MWKILQSSIKVPNTLRYFLLNKPYINQNKNLLSIRQYYNNISKSFVRNSSSKIEFKPLLITTRISLLLTSGGILHLSLKNRVLCDGYRMAGYHKSEKDVKFDWEKFWEYLKPHLVYFIAAIFGALIVAILNIEIPHIISNAINIIAKFNEHKNSDEFLNEIKQPALKLIIMYIGQSLFTFFYIDMLSKLGEKIAYSMKTDLFAAILKQDIAFFDQQRTGEIINRLTTDIQDFKSSFKQTVSGGLRASTQIIGCSISLFIISPHMTFVTLLCIPTVITIGSFIGSLLRMISREAQAQIEKTTAVADEAISNIRTVRAFAMEDLERQLFNNEAELAMDLNQRLGFGIGWFQAGTNLFLNSMVLATLSMGGYLLATDKLSAGDMMAFLMASQTIQRSLGQISLLFGSVMKGTAAGSRVFEYLNMEPKMPLKGGKILPDSSLKGDIEFNNVTFAYPTRPQQTILRGFTLKIPAGKTVAIVGTSGNGKSTVVNLLERFYDIIDGSITLDDHDIRSLDPSWLRQRALGLISQEPILFGTTIIENIRYGKPDASDDEVREAAKLANAHDFITNFPDGYQTVVGERGATLSGGQKQRIAIARALLKNPSVLLLDEATSALDAESEKIVQRALDKARKGRTVIVIAHRLSTIKNADIIVVLSNGKIVEMGSHDELTKKKGYYWSLTYQQQHEQQKQPDAA